MIVFSFCMFCFAVFLSFVSSFFQSFVFQFFKVAMYDQDGQPLNHEQLRHQMYACLTESEQRKHVDEQIGIMTTEHRDVWANAYQRLKSWSSVI